MRNKTSDNIAKIFREVEDLEDDVENLEDELDKLSRSTENAEWAITDIEHIIAIFKGQGKAFQAFTAEKLINNIENYIENCTTDVNWR